LRVNQREFKIRATSFVKATTQIFLVLGVVALLARVCTPSKPLVLLDKLARNHGVIEDESLGQGLAIRVTSLGPGRRAGVFDSILDFATSTLGGFKFCNDFTTTNTVFADTLLPAFRSPGLGCACACSLRLIGEGETKSANRLSAVPVEFIAVRSSIWVAFLRALACRVRVNCVETLAW
jgi:hypothetical protein